MIHLELERTEGEYGFDVQDERGHLMRLDNSSDSGGGDTGFRPMQAVLAAMAGCSAIDIVAILKKYRQPATALRIRVQGERQKDVVPALWERVHMEFDLVGEIDRDKAERACALSVDTYCSVAETLRRAGASVTWSLKLNGA